MKKQNICLTLLNEHKSVLAVIELALKDVAIGPVHNDLPLISTKDVKAELVGVPWKSFVRCDHESRGSF